MNENNAVVIVALKDAHETITWAVDNLMCDDPLISTWVNRHLQAISLLEEELSRRGISMKQQPHPDDIPF